jgi:hypothetical protein
MGRLYEQSVAVDNLRRTIAGFDNGGEDDLNGDPMAFARQVDVSQAD